MRPQSLTGSSRGQHIAESSHYFSTMWSLSAVVCSLLVIVATTDVRQCPGKSIEGLKDVVTLSPCKRLPCRLKKNTRQNITIVFSPDADMDKVNNKVLADVFGVSLPFVGVDGVSVCDKLETESGEKTSCPLKAGTKYVYRDSFPVLPFYPSIEALVHWSLIHNDKDLICFEVPVKIV